MRIGIVTQPLGHNYGGVLQNYALQQTLLRLGHKPITIYNKTGATWVKYILCVIRAAILRMAKGERCEIINSPLSNKGKQTLDPFVKKRINTTYPIIKYSPLPQFIYRLNCVIVGSDQVWRQEYNGHIEDMFLRFVRGNNVLRIAYAASFGVDEWEYSDKLTSNCKDLAKRFRAISVRENSGIKLCKEYLKVNAIEVLDPTLLLSADDYANLCRDIAPTDEKYVAAYLLDIDEQKLNQLNTFAANKGLKLKIFTAASGIKLSVEQWLATFRDASFVITDSFHGTVFSIIFHKEFISIANHGRGNSRFESLLSKFYLQNRLIELNTSLPDLTYIDWANVDKQLSMWKKKSIDYLSSALSIN